jgi:AmpD protein
MAPVNCQLRGRVVQQSDTELKIEDGRLAEANFIASPNCNDRPQAEVSLLVIHNISLPPGQFGSSDVCDLFTNQLDWDAHPYFDQIRGIEVSAHLLIDRVGEITQFVPFEKRAWHAGASSFEGRENCNDFSIGIELEGTDDLPFTEPQYNQLIRVTRALMRAYPTITPERITGHQHIAPGRKTDPGYLFDWDFYLNKL